MIVPKTEGDADNCIHSTLALIIKDVENSIIVITDEGVTDSNEIKLNQPVVLFFVCILLHLFIHTLYVVI